MSIEHCAQYHHSSAKDLFERDGFYMVRSAVSTEQARFMRQQVDSHFASARAKAFPWMRDNTITAPTTQMLHNSTILHAALSSIFGGPSAYRATARAEYSVNKYKGWHRDLLKHDLLNDLSGSYFTNTRNDTLDLFGAGPDGESQVFILAAMYLQDHSSARNDKALTVRPGTHRRSVCCKPDGWCPSRAIHGEGGACYNKAKDDTLHPRLGDVILMDYNTVHRSAHLPKNWRAQQPTNRVLFAMGYHAQDSAFSDAADRFYAIKDALFGAAPQKRLCSSHVPYTTAWIGCVRLVAQGDVQRAPLPLREERCDPMRPPDAPTGAGLRPGCPLATAPFEHSRDAKRSRAFLRSDVSRRLSGPKRKLAPKSAAVKLPGAARCSIEQRGCSADLASKPPTARTIAMLDSETVPPDDEVTLAANRAAGRTVFIAGASRGIGLALAKVYAASGYAVHATTRTPTAGGELGKVPGVHLHELDVLQPAHIAALRAKVEPGGSLASISTVIYNAGVKSSNMTYAMLVNNDRAFDVVAALLPAVLRSADKKLCIITSDRGSAKLNSQLSKKRQKYPYTISKQAATQRFVRTEPAWRAQGVAAVVMSPGYVKTAINGGWGDLTPVESATNIKQVLEKLSLKEEAGTFLSHDGNEIPW
jgi:NAD(P)-dependent dehydrogenase (short-subunit alcohol dehydrogenase family)